MTDQRQIQKDIIVFGRRQNNFLAHEREPKKGSVGTFIQTGPLLARSQVRQGSATINPFKYDPTAMKF